MTDVILNAKYNKDRISKKNVSINCVMNGRHISIPLDPDNTDYQAILEWVAEGNKIEDAD
tara:strand:+ start:403 stop:582 length:180 start_codon:yes stop_codon:yes gene_type:complete